MTLRFRHPEEPTASGEPGSPLVYPHTEPPQPAATLELAPGVRWVRMPLPFALDHVNVWLLEDGIAENGTVLWSAVDSGMAIDGVRQCWQRLLPSFPLRRQIVTHCHPDHLGLSDWLEQETGAPLFISQGEYTTAHLIWGQIGSYGLAATLELFKAHGLDPAIGEAIALRGNAFKHSIPEIPRHFHRLLDGDQLTIGDRVWSVIAGFGHSPEHSSLYCEELRMLISGDMLLPRISTNVSVMSVDPEADPLGLFLDSIGRFKELPADTLVLPSHGLPFQGIHARVAQLEAHHRDRCEALVGACGVPKTAFDLIPVLFSRAVSDPHQIKFAMGEAIAHLNYLEKAKTLIRLSDNGIIRFASTEH